MILQNLNDQVHQLTRPHRTTYTDQDTGAVTYPTELSLFDQLRQEQASGNRSGGGGASGSGSRSPVAIQALMLWMEIRETLNTQYILITGKDDHAVTPEAKLQKWGAHTQSDAKFDEAKRCLETVSGWAAAIRDLLHPVRRTEISGPCPNENCGATHAWKWVDGEYLRNTAITATGAEARCAACGQTWTGNALHSLAQGLGSLAA